MHSERDKVPEQLLEEIGLQHVVLEFAFDKLAFPVILTLSPLKSFSRMYKMTKTDRITRGVVNRRYQTGIVNLHDAEK